MSQASVPSGAGTGDPERDNKLTKVLTMIGLFLLGLLVGGTVTYFVNDKASVEDQLAKSEQKNALLTERLESERSSKDKLSGKLDESRQSLKDLGRQLTGAKAKAAAAAAAAAAAEVASTESGAALTSGDWIAQLGSFENESGAEQRRDEMVSAGLPADILWSSDYPGLTPGYWVVYVGPTDKSTAGSYEEDAKAAGQSDAFINNIRE